MFGVELHNVDLLPGILRLHIGTDGQIVVVSCDLAVLRQVGKVPDPLTAGKNGHEIEEIVAREQVLRDEIAKIIAEIEVGV